MRDFETSKIESQCKNCEVRLENYFCNLSETNRKGVELLQTTTYYQKDSRIFVEGQPSKGIYILCKGRVKLSTCSKDGRKIIMQIAEAGEVLGLSATVSASIHMSTAEAIESCRVNFIRNCDFLNYLEHNAEACLNAVKQLSQNYQTACLQICTLGLSATVADKLATLFLDWCNTGYRDTNGIHLRFSYTHEELAQMIGTSRETVTRLLKNFRDRKLIKRNGSEFIIPDRKKLEATIGTRQKY